MGPVLFILFTNDLPGFVTHGRLISYADDTMHIDSSPSDKQSLLSLQTRLEHTANELKAWFSANSLKLNVSKTDFMLLGSKNNLKKASGFKFSFDSTMLKPTNKLKIIGIVLEPSLSWEAQISRVCQKCNAILISI